MNRRHFLRQTTAAAALPIAFGGYGISAYAKSPLLDGLARSAVETDRVLVLVQLGGGNDGLNTVVPLDQYDRYLRARPTVALVEKELLRIGDDTGLHPMLGGLRRLHDEGELRIVQSVGYPVPNYSHFRSTDIWLTASAEDESVATGWMGRYLDREYPGYPEAYPNTTMPDPLAIQIGSSLSTVLEGPSANMGMSITDPATFHTLASVGSTDGAIGSRYRDELAFVRDIGNRVALFATPIREAGERGRNVSLLYAPPNRNPLSDQLRIVARLISGGLRTRVYVVSLTGFDTHANQLHGSEGAQVPHGTLLGQLSLALSAFQEDLGMLGLADRVITMTFSEFGRRIRQNDSHGTDHGAAAPLFVVGTNVIPGVLGSSPTIPDEVSPDDNVPMQYDFRSVYASLLADWFGATDAHRASALLRDFATLPIIRGTSSAESPAEGRDALAIVSVLPQPAASSARARVRSGGGHLRLSLFDGAGRERRVVVDGVLGRGEHEIPLDLDGLGSGTYYLRLSAGAAQTVRPLVVAR